ncbi:hypothetical protein [Leifsonia shinshuensis]
MIATSSIAAAPLDEHDGSVDPASIATAEHDSPAHPSYGDLDIVMLFLAGRGPIADRYPALADTLVPVKAPEQPVEAYEAVLNKLYEVDPEFHDNVTVPVQSGDPYLAEAAVDKFRADIELFSAEQPTGVGKGRCVVGVWVFVASALAVVVAAVVGAVAVPVYAVYYMPDESAKQFDLQKFAAALARTL